MYVSFLVFPFNRDAFCTIRKSQYPVLVQHTSKLNCVSRLLGVIGGNVISHDVLCYLMTVSLVHISPPKSSATRLLMNLFFFFRVTIIHNKCLNNIKCITECSLLYLDYIIICFIVR